MKIADSLDEIFRRIYRFNNRVPPGNYSEEFNEMREVAVISVGVVDSFFLQGVLKERISNNFQPGGHGPLPMILPVICRVLLFTKRFING